MLLIGWVFGFGYPPMIFQTIGFGSLVALPSLDDSMEAPERTPERKTWFHLQSNMSYFPLLVLKENLSLLETCCFAWGLKQMEDES